MNSINYSCRVSDARVLQAARVRSFNESINVASHFTSYMYCILDLKLLGHIIHNMVKTKMNNKTRIKLRLTELHNKLKTKETNKNRNTTYVRNA